ncbi:MarR family transcriptional regulator [Nonomuraea sp. NPDC046570]|uniref:MarR family winged helix-turn-helix transcriptional regulator n=1 Tax=Nonomuraea sp. NPDC046570 TaxID=3155255 RepID=UPI0033C9D84A
MEDIELSELFHRVTRSLRRGYVDQLEPLGLTPGQARALRAVIVAERPLRMVRLAEELRVVPRSVTPLVDALEQAGLVRREVDPASRRATLLVPTPEGERVYERVREARRRSAERVFAVLTGEQRDQLRDLLLILDEGAGEGGA